MNTNEDLVPRWYFGGIACGLANCLTHPVDMFKVQAQMAQKRVKTKELIQQVRKERGFCGFYDGLSATVVRGLTYSLARFGIYEYLKEAVREDDQKVLPVYTDFLCAGAAGAIGGVIGNPIEVVKIRMQSDISLPKTERWKYRNVFHGLWKMRKQGRFFRGWTLSGVCGSMSNMGQIGIYGNTKQYLLDTHYFEDNIELHLMTSITAGIIATTITHGFDVIKTRYLSAPLSDIKGPIRFTLRTFKSGPCVLLKGYHIALTRVVPQTVLTYLIIEQLRLNFGIKREEFI